MCRLKINHAWSAASLCVKFLGTILVAAKHLLFVETENHPWHGLFTYFPIMSYCSGLNICYTYSYKALSPWTYYTILLTFHLFCTHGSTSSVSFINIIHSLTLLHLFSFSIPICLSHIVHLQSHSTLTFSLQVLFFSLLGFFTLSL